MSLTQARTDIATAVQAIKTAWTPYTLQVETDNRDSINYATQEKPFLQLDTVFMSADQLDLGEAPKTRQWGQIVLSAVVKEGSGTVAATALLDFAIPYLERKQFVVVRTETAEAHPAKPFKGWTYFPLLINFSFTR